MWLSVLWCVVYLTLGILSADAELSEEAISSSAISVNADNQSFAKRIKEPLVLPDWISLVLHLSTEQQRGLSALWKLPFSGSACFGWIESGAYQIGVPLLLNTEPFLRNVDDNLKVLNPAVKGKFWRYSLGIGSRLQFTNSWMLGVYGYYDYTTDNKLLREISYEDCFNFSELLGTFNIGAELFTPLGRMIGNIYCHRMVAATTQPSEFFSSQRIAKEVMGLERSCDTSLTGFGSNKKPYICWGGDIKLCIDWHHWTLTLGGYCMQHSIIYKEALFDNAGVRAVVPINTYGSALEVKYTQWKITYGVKYTYDKMEKHQLSLSGQWHFIKPPQEKTHYFKNPERYLKPSQVSTRKGQKLAEAARLQARYFTTKRIQAFCENFRDQQWDNANPLDSREINELRKWIGKIPVKSTHINLEGIPVISIADNAICDAVNISVAALENALAEDKKTMNLSELYVARSLTQNLMALNLLYENKEHTIGVTREAGDMSIRFAPTEKQWILFNLFAAHSNNYIAKKDLHRLVNVQPNALYNIHEVILDRPMYQCGIAIYRKPQLGERLLLFEDILQEGIVPYQESIKREHAGLCLTEKEESQILQKAFERLKSTNDKLQERIISNLKLQMCALKLTTQSVSMRYLLLSFSFAKVNADNSLLNENERKWNSIVVGMRKLPLEMREKILWDVLEGSKTSCYKDIYGRREAVYWRKRLLSYDIQALSYNDLEPLLAPLYSAYLLTYLSSIQDNEDISNYLKIPYSNRGILF